jgi:hypothetical protein
MKFKHLTKGAFSFEIPEAMELADSLIEKCLGIRGMGADREGDVTGGAHEISGLPWPLIESFPVIGMSRQGPRRVIFVSRLIGGPATAK